MDDTEVMFLRALLQSYEIPFFIIGEHFGSIYLGIQIGSYNERRFIVPEENYEEAKNIIEEHRKSYELSFVNLDTKSKLRLLIEVFIYGWGVPSGKKKSR